MLGGVLRDVGVDLGDVFVEELLLALDLAMYISRALSSFSLVAVGLSSLFLLFFFLLAPLSSTSAVSSLK